MEQSITTWFNRILCTQSSMQYGVGCLCPADVNPCSTNVHLIILHSHIWQEHQITNNQNVAELKEKKYCGKMCKSVSSIKSRFVKVDVR